MRELLRLEYFHYAYRRFIFLFPEVLAMDGTANQKVLRHDRQTVLLLTDHLVITPREHARIWVISRIGVKTICGLLAVIMALSGTEIFTRTRRAILSQQPSALPASVERAA